ncbi:MAG TPA: radical SAM protein [Candidatus Limnocylindria bacterium]|nr:radical SAM protein [Candidatus Limnocylindria bacterium]
MSPGSSGFLSSGVVHLHPTLRCNLACAHCYSSSSPQERDALGLEALVGLLEALAGEGYDTLSLSGGEPLLYPEIESLLASAGRLGFKVNIVTNGTVLTQARLDRIAPHLSLVAVSVDGTPARHDSIRRKNGAFERAERGIGLLAGAGVQFGLSFCVTRTSLPDVPWVYEFSCRVGAKLLTLRPLAPIGRGQALASDESLTEMDLERLAVLTALLDAADGEVVRVHFDAARVSDLREQRQEAFPVLASESDGLSLRQMVNPLIVDERGTLVPFAYGVSRRFAAGSSAIPHEAVSAFRRAGAAPIRRLLTCAFDTLPVEGDAYVDWYAHLTRASYAA